MHSITTSPHKQANVQFAAWLREWRVNRTWVWVVVVLFLIGPVVSGVQVLSELQRAPGVSPSVVLFWWIVASDVYAYHPQLQNGFTPPANFHVTSDPAIGATAAIVAMGFGCVLWANDRNLGMMQSLLTPLSRVRLAWTKFALGCVLLLALLGFHGLLVATVDVSTGAHVGMAVLSRWAITSLTTILAGFSVGFVIGVMVTNWGIAVSLGGLSLYYPWIFGSIVEQGLTSGTPGPSPQNPLYPANLAGFIKYLSILQANGVGTQIGGTGPSTWNITMDTGVHFGPYVWFHWLWVLGIALLAGIGGVTAFARTPVEHFSELFISRNIGSFTTALLSIIIAYLLVRMAGGQTQLNGPQVWIVVLVLTVVVYVALRLLRGHFAHRRG